LTQKRVLFIVDAFDEGKKRSPLLEALIDGRVLRNATLLLTSRPNHLRDKMDSFHTRYRVEGFSYEQQKEFLCKYLKEEFFGTNHKSWDNLRDRPRIEDQLNEEKDLARNPLNLYIMCTLMNEKGLRPHTSRTALYEDLHNFIAEKARCQMMLSPEAMRQTVLQPLYKLRLTLMVRVLKN
jgi:hypothetical protein